MKTGFFIEIFQIVFFKFPDSFLCQEDFDFAVYKLKKILVSGNDVDFVEIII